MSVIGFDVRVGEHAGICAGRVRARDPDREVGAVAARREAGDDLPVVDGERDHAWWATKTMGGTAVPGGSVRNVTDQGKPWYPGPLENIGDRHFRVWPGQDRGGGRLQPRRDRAHAVQVDDAVDPDVPGAVVRLSRS